MLTAEEFAHALTPALVRVVHAGSGRAVLGVEFLDDEAASTIASGDLVLAAGAPTSALWPHLADGSLRCAGLVVRRQQASDDLVTECREHDLTLLALGEGVAWSAVVDLLHSALEVDRRVGQGSDGDLGGYGDLFAVAEHLGNLIGGPVTIEDAHSRVLAYSSRQDDTDPARVSTIIGRRVPREVRDHFRAHGVFRRLATSDTPFFVEQGPPGVKPRFVIPVRAGAEWLGSIWAVVDEPLPADRVAALHGVAEVVALHLLRVRARSELGRQLSTEQVRTLLRGLSPERATTLGAAPWRVVALAGPGSEPAETRRELWAILARRHGWSAPLLADLADHVFAVVTDVGDQPGSWDWLAALARRTAAHDPSVRVSAGPPASAVTELATSRARATEQIELGAALGDPATRTEDCWAALTLRRATRALDGAPDPLARLRAHDHEHGTDLVRTLAAVLDHWAEPRKAAAALGIHLNTVRYRRDQIRALVDLDEQDPDQRLALRLHLHLHAEP